ncbi:MAG TPA: isopeptide-forming domain-containing fimbrial protein, partial [Luteimonas sp.]
MKENRRRAHGLRNVAAGLLVACAAALPVSALHAQSVTNTATVSPPAGVFDPDETNNTASATFDVSTVPAYDFCPAGASPVFSLVNGVEIWQHEAGSSVDERVDELTAPVAGNLNGLMVDPVRNRLLFVQRVGSSNSVIWAYDAANGGWYQAVPSFASPDFPRAAIGPDGIGYLVAGGTNTPDVWRLTPDVTPGSFGYSVARVGQLSYDNPPTDPGSGDIAFDAAGEAWLSAGRDLYTIDFDAPTLVAVRQVRPLLNGNPSTLNWAGVAFGSDDALYVADNGGNGGYYAYDRATGALTRTASTGAGASRDLASCAFPQPAQAIVSVAKTLATVNGAPFTAGTTLQPGDVLGYDIRLSNTGNAVATLYPGDIVETLPEHTTIVATGNDFTCTGSDCPNTGAVNVPAGDEALLRFVVEVVDPLPSSVTAIANAVSVSDIDCDAAGNDCTESTPIGPVVTVSKSSDAGEGTAVAVGQTLTYTVDVVVGNAATIAPVTITDTLGTGLDFGAVTSSGPFTCVGELSCVLPAGTAPGTWSVSYTASVTTDAVTLVSNSVTTDVGSCSTCSTTNPLLPATTVAKSAVPAAGETVTPGESIAYTLTVTVANAPLGQPLTLADTLGAGLVFDAVTEPGAFTCTGALECVLPQGTAPGSYAVTYTATVESDATGTVANVVVASNPPGGDPDPVCTTCSTEHPVALSSVSVAKTADPATGSTVLPGGTITYTLSVTVADSATTQPVTLTDTLDEGLTFGAVTSAGVFQCTGTLECVLPAGQLPGSYSVSYTATVDADATGSLGNVVVASNPPGGDPDPVCTTCSTEHEVSPSTTTVVKTADPADGSTVLPGSTINYTLTVTVAESATTEALTLTDTLDEGLTFGAVTSAGVFQCTGTLECVLPAGQLPGSYSVSYTATVDADATGSLGNVVVASNPPGGDPDPVCTACSTEHEVSPSTTTVVKTANPADGSTVLPGATIEYTLAVTVADSATTQPLTLTDTLGAGLAFGEVTSAGVFQCIGTLECVLPAGQLPGTYELRYTATVEADATGTVGNVVVASNPPGGDPDPVCTTCSTEHEISPSTTSVAKTANPAAGTTVLPGDAIEYTLTVTVEDSATTQPLTLADNLGEGLSFGAVTDAGVFQCTGALSCVLPAGQLPGSYAVSYTATIDADATGTVGNVVVASNPPGGDPDPVCTTCTTEHPIVPATVEIEKTSDPASGTEVLPGATIGYTLTVTVGNSATTEPLTLTDTLGEGLGFGEVTSTGPFQCTGNLECVLPAGQLPGTYTVEYTAVVEADATGTVGNVVVASNPPGGDPDPVCTTCTTEHPIVPAEVDVVKTANPAEGTAVLPGATLEYTLAVTVSNSATTQPLTLADTLGEGLAFGSVTVPGVFECSGALTCVLPAGQLPGTYELSYTATVEADATGTVGNVVVASNPPGGDPDPVCTTCSTEHPIVPATVNVAKASDPANGSSVLPGATIGYTLTVTVANSATTEPLTLVDTLGEGLAFGAVSDAGAFQCSDALTCVLPAGQLPGSYEVRYTAIVDADATGSVGNVVVASNPPGGDPDP